MKWLTTIGNVVRWILGIVPQVTPAAPPAVPKKPLTPADLGWDQEPTRPTTPSKPPPRMP